MWLVSAHLFEVSDLLAFLFLPLSLSYVITSPSCRVIEVETHTTLYKGQANKRSADNSKTSPANN